ncbi:MAG: hypothetical protein DRR19_01080 [Candidatus Parabeggiatoa sp. nov. 1]|nr:MAG: hypothetical protein DRR19_01080 [Gammaproteobacteria bacterium]
MQENPIKSVLKQLMKEIIWSRCRHKKGEKRDICCFSTRRGGSTWFMEIIGVNRGIRYLNQPFSIYSAVSSHHIHLLPKTDYGEFIHLDKNQLEELKRFCKALFAGHVVVNTPWRIWQHEFDFRSSRLVLKIVVAKAMIDWFDSEFDVDIVYSTRHPIPVSLSIIRNGWGLTVQAYLKNRTFMEKYLTETQINFCWDVLKKGTLLEQHVLNWTLENLVPLKLLAQHPDWIYVSYEKTLLEPEVVIEDLAFRLDLEDIERMKKIANIPSLSTKHLSTKQVRSLLLGHTRTPEQTQFLIERWKKDVSPDEEKRAMEILEKLEAPVYVYGETVSRLDTKLTS